MAEANEWEKLADYHTYASNCARNVARHMRTMNEAVQEIARAKAMLRSNEDEIKKWRERNG